MNRTDFQQLAEVRIREAEALLAAGLWDGAYYLAGYAVECGLKACLSKLTQAGDFPPDKKALEKIYTHKLVDLLEGAKLRSTLTTDGPPGSQLADYWDVAKDWSEAVRYQRIAQLRAEQLIAAISDPSNGVLAWIRKYW